MKSVLFLGASNTFGVGLHTFRDCYMSEDGVKLLKSPYFQTPIDDEFIKSVRWSQLVANHLNLNEVNIAEAGGSPANSLYILSERDTSNDDYIFFEFSGIFNYCDRYFHNPQFETNYPRTPHEIEAFLTNGKNDRPELRERILKWLDAYDPYEFMDEVLGILKNKIETELTDKKVVILFWHDQTKIDFSNPKYNWIDKYMVKFPLKNNVNNHIVHDWVLENKYRIVDEHPFSHLMAEDIHAGIKGNSEVAKIIINYIDEKNNTDSWR